MCSALYKVTSHLYVGNSLYTLSFAGAHLARATLASKTRCFSAVKSGMPGELSTLTHGRHTQQ